MKIGIDLTDLQSDSATRGIGEVTKQVTNRLLGMLAKNNDVDKVYLFLYKENSKQVIELFDYPDNLEYAVEYYDNSEKKNTFSKKIFSDLFRKRDPRIDQLDVFLNFSLFGILPKTRNQYLVWYDMIPYTMYEVIKQYARSFPANQLKKNKLLMGIGKKITYFKLKKILKSAKHIIAISESTKQDILTMYPRLNKPVDVAFLGVTDLPSKPVINVDIKELPNKPYLLFVGGVDAKRELVQLVKQFENLKQAQHDIQLVFAGKHFSEIDKIPFEDIKEAIKTSQYKRDIITYGYISDEFKAELYKNAFIFVYPTLYEGFGLPLLEAMLNKTLVLTYNNSSLPEVGGKHAFYVDNGFEMASKLDEIFKISDAERKTRINDAYQYAKQFTWDKTAEKFYEILMQSKKSDGIN
ncbi:MAG: glycosyltransferase family 4 protein [Mycoplasmataceae bacterium]|jgi:glycosyltransferase involved in cell wall biosynthesis|nr:glycosyltransferase family 4 protein [Mycoplasmataceae bacterium]